MSDDKPAFVSMTSLRRGQPDTEAALAEIRSIYFKTTKRTIQHDLAHAIELLKAIPTEEDRERARVYMDGLAQMRSEWSRGNGSADRGKAAAGRGKGEGGRGKAKAKTRR